MSDLLDLEEDLSRPDDAVVADLTRLGGNLVVLGAGGKMGPSLAMMAARAVRSTGQSVTAVSRFGDAGARARLEAAGVETVASDLMDPGILESLPDAPNVVIMAGRKFGSTSAPEDTWATNALLPGLAARRYRSSRVVVFSTGNVYPFTEPITGGPTEDDPVGPVGEYAQSARVRELIVTSCSRRFGTPMAILRINYAIEPRYGVVRDLVDRIQRRESIDVTTGHVNIIWQRDAIAIALRALGHCRTPPKVLNVTGTETVSVRALAEAIGVRLGTRPTFVGREADRALLSNAASAAELFGPPPTSREVMVDRVCSWVLAGGAGLGKPTHYDERSGAF